MTAPNKYCKDKEWLYDQYVNKRKSITKIAKELDIMPETVRLWIHRHEILVRTGSECHSNDLHWNYGKHHSEETKQKISIANARHEVSEETRAKLSEKMLGEGNPRYGVKLSQDQIERQKSSLIKFYQDHPEAAINLSENRKQFHIDHPDVAKEQGEYLKQYYKNHPEILEEAAKKRRQYYIDHPLSNEEKIQRAAPIFKYFDEHPEARKDHSLLMKVNNPSMRPEVAAKISDSMVEWHKNNANPVNTGSIPGRVFTCKNGKKIWLRSSYEFRFASILEELKICWEYEPYAFSLNNLHTSYRPDIYLPDLNIWIEIKGYLSWSSKQKLIEFNKIYPNEKLLLIYLNQIECIEEMILSKESIDIRNSGILIEDQVKLWYMEDIELSKLKEKLKYKIYK